MTITADTYARLAKAVYGDLTEGDPVSGTNFSVLKVSPPDQSGFYGAVFFNKTTHKLVVAFRGTQHDDLSGLLRDAITDGEMLGLGINQQLDDARDLMQAALGIAKVHAESGHPDSLTVTGHSLGGTLAQVMSYEYNLYGVTFNAYGAAGIGGVPEDGSIAAGHSNVVNYMRATDAVALANTQYGEVKRYATVDDVAFTLAGADAGPERILDEIAESAHLNVSQTHSIDFFVGPDSILTDANAQRYQDYKRELALYGSWIHSAASDLGAVMRFNPYVDGLLLSSYLSNKVTDFLFGEHHENASDSTANMAYIYGTQGADTLTGSHGSDLIFGDDGVDILYGLKGDDHMFGGARDDYLDGQGGSDKLHGGAGHDRYNFVLIDLSTGPASTDVVVDSDGDGQIEIDNNVLSVGNRLSATEWDVLNGDLVIFADLSLTSQTLVIKDKDTGSRILVKDWNDGDLGIQLGGAIPAPAMVDLTTGDDLFGHDGNNAGDNRIEVLGGNDGISAGSGADVISGGDGVDLIYGGSGDDHLSGGADGDLILDDSEWTDMQDWSDKIGPDGKSQREHAQERIAELGASVVATGKGWYVYTTSDGDSTTYIIVTAGGYNMLDPNQAPSGRDTVSGGLGDDVIWTGEGDDAILASIFNERGAVTTFKSSSFRGHRRLYRRWNPESSFGVAKGKNWISGSARKSAGRTGMTNR